MTETTIGGDVPAGSKDRGSERLGYFLVFLSAFVWSFGGALARNLEANDGWTIVFWRALWAAAFILGFLLWRDGLRGTLALFRSMGLPGIAVAICFASASSSFIMALQYTTVANVVLMQAGVPLLAALMAWLIFRETIALPTWLAIGAVIIGVAVMVSESFTGDVSPIGDGLALFIALCFSTATVITRRFAHVRMTPATCLGAIIACGLASTQAPTFSTTGVDMAWLFVFGALSLGLGLATFASGARLIPAAFAALLGTLETVLGPVWVWLFHNEVPSTRTMVGGIIIFLALLTHLGLEFWRQSRPQKPGTTCVPVPN